MKTEQVCLRLDDFDKRLMVRSLVGFRNDLIGAEMPTEDVDDLILKVIDAQPEKKRRRLFSREER